MLLLLRQIIKNEVTDLLEREPSEQELNNFMDEISDYLLEQTEKGKKVFLVEVEKLIRDYRNSNYRQCEECGVWYEIGSDNWNDLEDVPTCRDCKDYPDPDIMPGGKDYPY